jgi:hypothetical protein
MVQVCFTAKKEMHALGKHSIQHQYVTYYHTEFQNYKLLARPTTGTAVIHGPLGEVFRRIMPD